MTKQSKYLLAAGLAIALMAYAHFRKKNALAECSISTVVTSLHEQSRHNRGTFFVYRFEVDGKRYRGSVAGVHVDYCMVLDSLHVEYACDNPDISTLEKR